MRIVPLEAVAAISQSVDAEIASWRFALVARRNSDAASSESWLLSVVIQTATCVSRMSMKLPYGIPLKLV